MTHAFRRGASGAFRRHAAVAALAAGAFAFASGASARDVLKLSSTPPGTAPYLFLSTFANTVTKFDKDIDIQINATGPATRHYLQAAQGKVDLFYNSPLFYTWLKNNDRVYKKIKDGPKLAANTASLFSMKLAVYQFIVHEDSGIRSFADIKGRKAFLGPPAGAATVVATVMVEGVTGLKAGKDFEVLRLGWGAGVRAFQDRQIDLLSSPTPLPSSVIQQLALTGKIRVLGATKKDFESNPALGKLLKSAGRTLEEVPPGVYGKNQTNTEPVYTVGSWGGIGVRRGVPDAVVYRMVKAFWDNLADVHGRAAGFKTAITLENAFRDVAAPLHPGAAKYYREKGLTIPDGIAPK